jgi:hypothetical protein
MVTVVLTDHEHEVVRDQLQRALTSLHDKLMWHTRDRLLPGIMTAHAMSTFRDLYGERRQL